jgi:hypothetical protein
VIVSDHPWQKEYGLTSINRPFAQLHVSVSGFFIAEFDQIAIQPHCRAKQIEL